MATYVATVELVGTSEIAVMLGVTRQRVNQLARRPDFPQPVADLAAGKIWRKDEVEAWAEATGRQIAP